VWGKPTGESIPDEGQTTSNAGWTGRDEQEIVGAGGEYFGQKEHERYVQKHSIQASLMQQQQSNSNPSRVKVGVTFHGEAGTSRGREPA